MIHPALQPGNLALITGAASGIGLAAAKSFARLGLKLVLVDRDEAHLKTAAADVAGEAITIAADISTREGIEAVKARLSGIGLIDVVMNNAAISPSSSVLDGANWQVMLDTNLWGVIYGTQAFVPDMVASGRPGLVINTGSKQGITTPPGNPAYNVAKAGVKAFTEALQHELRNGPNPAVTAHLLIPGFVWTGLTKGNRTEKPDGAWTPDETVDFMLESLERGDFYILCPDNDVSRALDEKRIAWAAGDIIDNRPPLSRWHPDYAAAFAEFVKGE